MPEHDFAPGQLSGSEATPRADDVIEPAIVGNPEAGVTAGPAGTDGETGVTGVTGVTGAPAAPARATTS